MRDGARRSPSAPWVRSLLWNTSAAKWRSSEDSSDKDFGIPPDLAAIALLLPTDPFFASWSDGYTCAWSSPARRSSRRLSDPCRASNQNHCGVESAKIAIIDLCCASTWTGVCWFRCKSNRARFASDGETLQSATVDASFDALRGVPDTILRKVLCACDRQKRGVEETS